VAVCIETQGLWEPAVVAHADVVDFIVFRLVVLGRLDSGSLLQVLVVQIR